MKTQLQSHAQSGGRCVGEDRRALNTLGKEAVTAAPIGDAGVQGSGSDMYAISIVGEPDGWLVRAAGTENAVCIERSSDSRAA